MPIDLEMLVSASPPLYAYSAFVDSQYTRFTSDGYCPTQNCDREYSFHESGFFSEHSLSPHLQYSELGSSFEPGKSFGISSSGDHTGKSNAEVFSCSYDQPENKLREKKKVSFADDKGLALVQVRSIPDSPRSSPKWTHNLFSFITGGIKPKVESTYDKRWKLAFDSPPYSHSVMLEKLESNSVVLESVSIEEDREDTLKGTIKVKNTAYSKEVIVRVTYDRWMSYEDISCTYKESSATFGDGGQLPSKNYDTFTFEAVIPQSASRYEVVEFCVCYRAGGQVFWDNNGGINYRLVAQPITKMSSSPKHVSSLLPARKEPVSPKFTRIGEHLELQSTCTRIDAWETLLKEQPYW